MITYQPNGTFRFYAICCIFTGDKVSRLHHETVNEARLYYDPDSQMICPVDITLTKDGDRFEEVIYPDVWLDNLPEDFFEKKDAEHLALAA